MVKGKNNLKGRSKTKFEELLQMDMKTTSISALEDLELERKLAKKLKVKDGKVRGADDDINMLIGDISSVLDSSKYEATLDAEDFPFANHGNRSIVKKRKSSKSLEKGSKGNMKEDIVEGVSDQEQTNGANVVLEEICAKKPSRKRNRKRNLLDPGHKGDPLHVAHDGESNTGRTGIASGEALVHVLASDHTTKYVAPHLRSRAGNESEEQTRIRRQVRGLLNRLSESNIESITAEIASIFHSVSRSVSSKIISEEVLASCSNGPRGNEQYAAVFAAFVAGMACSVGIDFGAKLIASLAKNFEDEYLKEDNVSLRNLTLLLSYLCIFGVCSCDLIYDFLMVLSKRLTEIDVSTIQAVLQYCGMKIRIDDPAAMINFIQSVQSRVNQLKACAGEGQTKINGKRMEFMLETICDIKNNKKRCREDTVQHTRIKKWLQKLRVEDILLRGLKWGKLLDPNKKGQWWLSGDMAASSDNIEEVASTIDKEVLEAQKMLQLAAAQRMNTDARRAIFCIIMSGEDYIDAFEKLLRLDLPGKQDREIMRVIVECCLQEKVFNKYYTVLASKLCEHDKNHKFTLQYCVWDHFKELESMQVLRSMHLAKFVAEMVGSFTLSLAVLKTVDLIDPKILTPKRIIHFRILFETIFDYPDKLVWNIFTRVAAAPELETLRSGVEFFVREYVLKTNNAISGKFKIAKKALTNMEGVLM